MKKILLSIATLAVINVNAQIENFDGISLGTFTNKGGNAAEFSTTATPPEGAKSLKCGYSKRDGSPYDNIEYTLTNNLSASDVAGLKNGTKKFKMNLATTATAGIRVLIKLSSTVGSEFNSEYDVITTKGISNQWEELTFAPNINIGNLANGSVNKLVIFFAIEGTGSQDQFFFDDLRIDNVSSVEEDNNPIIAAIYPNPASGLVSLTLPIIGQVKATLLDATGKMVTIVEGGSTAGVYNGKVDVTNLNEGLYFIHLTVDGKVRKTQPIVVTK